MVYTVSSAFQQFQRKQVDIDSNQAKAAIASRNWLQSNIESLSTKGLMPKIYKEKCIAHGSFARKTKIRPIDDIDIMICFSGDFGYYNVVIPNVTYTIRFDKGIQLIKGFTDEQGNLNSRKVLENLKQQLAGIQGYKKADIHRDHEAVTLQLTSYPWNFDIVPCFYTDQGFYLIPNGEGNWKNTDPRIDQKRISYLNQKYNEKVLGLVRLMKYWKRIRWGNSLSSYAFESIILNFFEAYGVKAHGDIPTNVGEILNYLSNAIKYPIDDSKHIQTDLNTLSTDEKNRLSTLAKTDWENATKAILWSTEMLNNPKNAINEWQEIFGDKFPNYGK